MFSKAKSKDDAAPRTNAAESAAPARDQSARRASASAAPSKSNGRPRPSRPGGVPSIVSADMILRGVIESAGEVQFDGEIEGDLHAKGLVIGEGAKVNGEIVAEKVRVCGNVEGAIRAVEVELAASALVRGDIMHTSLSIESGARFEGNCRHSDDPLNEKSVITPATASKPVPRPTPKPSPVNPTSEMTVDAEVVSETEVSADDGSSPELMPQRAEPSADRSFVQRSPAAADLR